MIILVTLCINPCSYHNCIHSTHSFYHLITPSIQDLTAKYPSLYSSPPDLRWNYPLLATVFKDVFASLDFSAVYKALDYHLLMFRDPQGFQFVMTLLREISGENVPDAMVYEKWNNVKNQKMFLMLLVDSGNRFVNFAASPRQIVGKGMNYEIMNSVKLYITR